MIKYLKINNMIQSEQEAYKADGLYQYQFDFHKAMYGCMSIIWDIVHNYATLLLLHLKKLMSFLHCKSNVGPFKSFSGLHS